MPQDIPQAPPRWHSRDEKRGPEAPCVLAAFDRDGKATFGIAFESTDAIAFKRFVVTEHWTHWTPLPPRPKP